MFNLTITGLIFSKQIKKIIGEDKRGRGVLAKKHRNIEIIQNLSLVHHLNQSIMKYLKRCKPFALTSNAIAFNDICSYPPSVPTSSCSDLCQPECRISLRVSPVKL